MTDRFKSAILAIFPPFLETIHVSHKSGNPKNTIGILLSHPPHVIKNIPLEGAITQNSYLYLSPVLLKRFEKCKINLFKLIRSLFNYVLRNNALRNGLDYVMVRLEWSSSQHRRWALSGLKMPDKKEN